MKNTKRVLALLIALMLMLSLCACGNNGKTNDSQNMQSLKNTQSSSKRRATAKPLRPFTN